MLAGAERAGILHRDRVDAVRPQHRVQQGERLRGARDDQHRVRLHAHAPHPREPVGHGPPQPGRAARVAVAELLGGQLGEHRPLRPQPGGPGKGGEVGPAGREVDSGRRGPQRVEHLRAGFPAEQSTGSTAPRPTGLTGALAGVWPGGSGGVLPGVGTGGPADAPIGVRRTGLIGGLSGVRPRGSGGVLTGARYSGPVVAPTGVRPVGPAGSSIDVRPS